MKKIIQKKTEKEKEKENKLQMKQTGNNYQDDRLKPNQISNHIT